MSEYITALLHLSAVQQDDSQTCWLSSYAKRRGSLWDDICYCLRCGRTMILSCWRNRLDSFTVFPRHLLWVPYGDEKRCRNTICQSGTIVSQISNRLVQL